LQQGVAGKSRKFMTIKHNMNKKLSIVICNWNKKEYVLKCVESVSEMREIKPATIWFTGLKNKLISAMSIALTGIVAVPLVIFLPLKLFLLQKKADS